MRKSWVAAAILIAAGLGLAAGRPGVVQTRDGTTYEGTVDERDSDVIVTVHGIDTTVLRDNIATIKYGDFAERWEDDYAKLQPKDVGGRVAAARKAFDQRHYDLAEKALREAQSIDPNDVEAAELLKATISQRRLERGGNNSVPANPTPGGPANTGTGTGPVSPPLAWNILTGEQINRIKQTELRESDTQVHINFANNVRKKFYDATPTLDTDYKSYGDFQKETALRQALRILHDGSAELVKDVKITNDPNVIIDFRRDAMPLVLNGCATSQCHGGNNSASAKFALIVPGSDSGSTYTNFYVLQSAKVGGPVATSTPTTNESMAGGPQSFLFDRTRPEMSLILQYGLAETSAQLKHPKVRGYVGIYPRGRDDPKYKTVLAFISTLSPVQPEYGIDFKMTRKMPATQP